MSQKSGKKLRKRVDDEVEVCAKMPAVEINNKPLEETNIENGLEKEGNVNVPENMGESEINGTTNNVLEISNDPEHIVQEETVKEVKIEEETQQDKVEIDNPEIIEAEVCNVIVNNEENEKGQEKIEENQNIKADESESKISTENELEPLLLEAEEVDPELQFDENSDVDSQKSSPVIRCRTRRSQTRNIPTPKTPKTIDTNNDDKASECSDKPSVLTVPTSEGTDTESELSVFKPVVDIYDTNEKLFVKTSEEDFDSLQNVSTKAVVGGDTTRNVDLSSYPEDEFEFSPFLIQSQKRSVGETLKLLSSRRSIRPAKEYMLQNSIKKDYKTLPPPLKRSSVEKLAGMKRKNHNGSPDYTKRFKTESPSLLSHISSPFVNIKGRFGKSEIPSSTPKLTGYKSKNVFDNTNVSKITLNETEDVAEKKWCTVM